MEEQSADQADATGEADPRQGSDQAILSACGGDEKGRVQQGADREDAHHKGNGLA